MARERLKGMRFDAGSLHGVFDRFVASERERMARVALTPSDWSFINNARMAFEGSGMAPADVELRISALAKRLIDKKKGVTNG